MLRPLTKPALFVTGTDTGVGKTIVAAAIADALHRRGVRVGVFKPVASGCSLRESRVVSEDAQMLGAVVGDRFDQDVICPFRYVEPLTPAVAAARAGQPIDWSRVQAALDVIVESSDLVIVEGAGGLHVPLCGRFTVLDVIRALGVPALCVSRPGLGTINQTVLTVDALRGARVACAGVVVNRFPREPGVAELTNVEQLERWGGGPVRCVVPEAWFDGFRIPREIAEVVARVDWQALARPAPAARR